MLDSFGSAPRILEFIFAAANRVYYTNENGRDRVRKKRGVRITIMENEAALLGSC